MNGTVDDTGYHPMEQLFHDQLKVVIICDHLFTAKHLDFEIF